MSFNHENLIKICKFHFKKYNTTNIERISCTCLRFLPWQFTTYSCMSRHSNPTELNGSNCSVNKPVHLFTIFTKCCKKINSLHKYAYTSVCVCVCVIDTQHQQIHCRHQHHDATFNGHQPTMLPAFYQLYSVSQKSSPPLKLLAIFSLRLSIFL